MIRSEIGTRRLALEPICRRHAAPLFEALRNRHIYAHIPIEPPVSVAEPEARYAFLETGGTPAPGGTWLSFAARPLPDGPYIGRIEATIGSGHADIAYLLDPRHWGRGYATEAVAGLVD